MFRILIASMALLILLVSGPAFAQITVVPNRMHFQGRLTRPDGTSVPDGDYTVRFSLWDAASGGTEKWNQTHVNVPVRNGIIAVLIGLFNNDTFAGDLFLEIKIGTEAPLTPRQPLASVAYAKKADLALTVPNGSITSNKIADGTITAADFAPNIFNPLAWLLGGNSGVTTGFLGTTDNRPLEFRANNRRAMRYSYAENIAGVSDYRSINVLGGSEINSISSGVVGATIAGGGLDYFTGADFPNRVEADFGTIGGGQFNTVSGANATIAGGAENIASGNRATIGGGQDNLASSEGATVGGGILNEATFTHATTAGGRNNTAGGNYAFVGGGNSNMALGAYASIAGGSSNDINADFAAIAGGQSHSITATHGSIGGGSFNSVTGNYGTIPGGTSNTAAGAYSFAAGRRAKANHNGAFVWADQNNADFASTAVNEFNVRASGGIRLFTNSGLTAGVTLLAGDSTWNSVSDRNAKTNFQPVDVLDVLERLVSLPLTTWNYKANLDIRHIGLMAQDFFAAFKVGVDDKHISTVDADGVAFAAIQGLYHKVKALEAENAQLKSQNAELQAQLSAILTRLEKVEIARQK